MKRIQLQATVALAIILLLGACSTEPEPIAYGSDVCHFCRMTIVDKAHSAQLVSTKGKQHKYDAIECLVHNLPEWQPDQIGRMLVADFENPGLMTEATEATYLISEAIKSPMGANLSAFESQSAAEETRAQHSGEILSWDELQLKLTAQRESHSTPSALALSSPD